jgi:hypothetical protein
MLTIHSVLSLWPLRSAFHRHHSLDHGCAACIARASTAKVLHNTTLALGTTHHVSRARIESAPAPGLLTQLFTRLQRTHAGSHPPLFTTHRIRRCDSRLDSRWLLVLLIDTRRPGRSRRSQRWQGEHFGCEELVGAMAIAGTAVNSVPSTTLTPHNITTSFHPASDRSSDSSFSSQRHMTRRNVFVLSSWA